MAPAFPRKRHFLAKVCGVSAVPLFQKTACRRR
jgi:hypothetical protein